MPNPNGVNQFDAFAAEEPYGAIKALKEKLRDVPVETAPALNAPTRAQARAASGQRGAGGPMLAGVPPAEAALAASPPPAADLASVWGEIAAHPEASELVRLLAEQARGGP